MLPAVEQTQRNEKADGEHRARNSVIKRRCLRCKGGEAIGIGARGIGEEQTAQQHDERGDSPE